MDSISRSQLLRRCLCSNASLLALGFYTVPPRTPPSKKPGYEFVTTDFIWQAHIFMASNGTSTGVARARLEKSEKEINFNSDTYGFIQELTCTRLGLGLISFCFVTCRFFQVP